MSQAVVLEPAEVWAYLVSRELLPADARGAVREVGDGNMNRVFLAIPDDTAIPSLAVKQAPPWIQRLGPSAPMSPERALIEARALRTFAEYAPRQTPRVLDVDPTRFAFTMEDLSDLTVLRTALNDGASLGRTSAEVGELVGRVTFATSVAGATPQARAALIADSVNPLLAEVTLQYLLGDPFVAAEHNHHHPALGAAVESLRRDPAVRTELAALRAAFGAKTQALVHGDLHSGSVMVGVRDGEPVVRVIDPEFAMVGPIGLDLGLYIANVVIAALRSYATGATARGAAHLATVADCWDAFCAAWRDGWPGRVDPLLDDGWLLRELRDTWRDTLGYAAVELVRRVAGYSHASDLETLPDPGPASAVVLSLGHKLLVDREICGSRPDPRALARLVSTSWEAQQ
ncbi:S-methyl-5-thioribose kinase [Cryptosporangium aurantiacum]|uniref:S-methyl-5-thioribose kinase n=1 Tax=Cryptosporangium aurantiacum TaxID=134849 RepID=A0A1M7MEA5_9ACTN|nr:S-methyl-5-thioribose kinase [Cryptosporangium aurantiacum]SHM89094.1 5'-methylthioribose kinase [Cryptosporangium aurantiacum]